MRCCYRILGLSLMGLAACCTAPVQDDSIPPCRWQPGDGLLSESALQCWMGSIDARWRRLKHNSHYDTLVVYIEVSSLEAATRVTRQFVEAEGRRYSEIVIYAYPQPYATGDLIRRVRWTERNGY